MNGARALGGVLALLTLLTSAPTQGVVEPWRVLRAMEVEGVVELDRDQIATMLACDPEATNALAGPLDEEVAALLAARVRELHRRGGYRDAMASGTLADGVVRIQLAAGPRYRCGRLECSGAVAVSHATIRDALAAEPDAIWREGAPARADDGLPDRIAAAARATYRAAGRHHTKLTVDVTPAEDRLVASIRVDDEGPESRVRSVALAGEPDAVQRDALLQSLQFEPGCVASAATLAALRRQVEITGRYLTVDLDVGTDPAAELDPLTIRVQPRPGAPPFGTFSSRDALQLRDAIDRLVAKLEAGDSLTMELELTEPATWGRFRSLPGTVHVHVSRAGTFAEMERVRWGDHDAGPASLDVAEHGMGLLLGELRGLWQSDAALGVSANLSCTFSAATGDGEFRWGVGLSKGAGDGLAVSLHPATAMHLLSRATEVRRDGDTLVVRFGATEVHVGPGGVIDGDRIAVPDAGRLVLAITPKATVDARRAALRPPAESALDGAALLLRVAADALGAVGTATDARVPLLLRALLDLRNVARPPVSAPRGEPGWPASDRSAGTTGAAAAFASMCAVRRDVDGRWVEISGAFSSLMNGNLRATEIGFRSLARDEKHGPLSCAVVAALHGVLGRRGYEHTFRKLASERWTFDRFYADAADLGTCVPTTPALPQRIGAAWRAMLELAELFRGLPDGDAGDLAAWRKGLELLWDNGGDALLRTLLLGP